MGVMYSRSTLWQSKSMSGKEGLLHNSSEHSEEGVLSIRVGRKEMERATSTQRLLLA